MKIFPTIASFFLSVVFILSACRQKEGEQGKSATISGASQPSFLNVDPKTKYVGDEACASCHFKIFKSFKQTGMGRSYYPFSTSDRIEDVVRNNHVYDPRSNFHYEVIAKENSVFQVEYRLDDKGKRSHELIRKIDYVIGSGNHARTYLTEENGFLFEMPLTWYSQKKNWGLSPGFEYVNYRFSRPITAGCMNCHNSYAEYVPFSGNRYSKVPHGIGCERCHGPGELHIEEQTETRDTSLTKKELTHTIVNPRRLSPALQMDVCLQCHLQGVVGIFKSGKQKNDFRPGTRLQGIFSVFVLDNLAPGDLRVASHGERLALSACYTKSNGALVCFTCHDPHQPVQTVERSLFNETCMNCHNLTTLSKSKPSTQHNAKGDCVACHMPQGKTSDVVHANFTDHWIQTKPAPYQTARTSATITLKDFFAEKDAGADLRLNLAYLQYYDDSQKDRDNFEHALSRVRNSLQINPGNEEALYRLGLAFSDRDRLEEAVHQFRSLVKKNPNNSLAKWQLAMVLNKMGHKEEAVDSYQDALRLFSENAAALTQLGNLYLQLDKPDEALKCFQKAGTVQPSYAPAHNALGEFFLNNRMRVATAKRHFLDALRLDPDYIQALHNLGILGTALREYKEAENYFMRVLALDPRYIPAYGNIALTYSLQGRTAEARSFLIRALQIDPQNIRIKEMLKRMEASEKTKKKK